MQIGIKLCYVLLSNFSMGGISAGITPDGVKKHLLERGVMIREFFPELSAEDVSFAASMYWKSFEEIRQYFIQYLFW